MDTSLLNESLSLFTTIGLKEINSLSLQNRVDTKFLLNSSEINTILKSISNSYQVVEIDNKIIQHYSNIYYDTPNNSLFTQHQNGKLNRYKIRKRKYVNSNLSFLEVKFKNNKGTTIKKRMKTENFSDTLNSEESKFIFKNSGYKADLLEVKLISDFNRVTVVNFKTKERTTFDFNLNYSKNIDVVKEIKDLVIVEIKQDREDKKSEIKTVLKSLGIRKSSFSKFCVTSLLLDTTLKYNTFKPALMQLKKNNYVPIS